MKKDKFRIRFSDEEFNEEYKLNLLISKIEETQDVDWLYNHALDLDLNISKEEIEDLIEEFENDYYNFKRQLKNVRKKPVEKDEKYYVVYTDESYKIIYISRSGYANSLKHAKPYYSYEEAQEKADWINRNPKSKLNWKVKEVKDNEV